MAIPNGTVVQLAKEGIVKVANLLDFDKESLRQIEDNLRRLGGRVPDPMPGAPQGASVPQPPYVFGAKLQMRLEVASKLVQFYFTIGRPVTAANLMWNLVMTRFKELWQALVDQLKSDNPDTRVISKSIPIIRWAKAFADYLRRCVGVLRDGALRAR